MCDPGPAFDDSGLLLKAVLAGQGAGLLPAAMAALDVAEGRLVKLAEIVRLEDFAYYLVCPEAIHERPKIAAFRTWILKAATGPSSKDVVVTPPDAGAARQARRASRPRTAPPRHARY